MNFEVATNVLIKHTSDPKGVCAQMRMGFNPGYSALLELSQALESIFENTEMDKCLAREITFGCAVIQHFYEDYRENMRAIEQFHSIELILMDIHQKAFHVLAGHVAKQWGA